MKKLALIGFVICLFMGCSDEMILDKPNDYKKTESISTNTEFDFSKLCENDLKELLSFFNTDDVRLLAADRYYSESRTESVVVIVKPSFGNKIDSANKAVYLKDNRDNAQIAYSIVMKEKREGVGRIEIFKHLNLEKGMFDIDFDLSNKRVSFSESISNRSYNDCVDDCVREALEGVFINGSWIQQVAFLLNPIQSFYTIAFHCFYICAGSDEEQE